MANQVENRRSGHSLRYASQKNPSDIMGRSMPCRTYLHTNRLWALRRASSLATLHRIRAQLTPCAANDPIRSSAAKRVTWIRFVASAFSNTRLSLLLRHRHLRCSWNMIHYYSITQCLKNTWHDNIIIAMIINHRRLNGFFVFFLSINYVIFGLVRSKSFTSPPWASRHSKSTYFLLFTVTFINAIVNGSP